MTQSILIFTKNPAFRALVEPECKNRSGFAPVVHDKVEELEAMIDLLSEIELLIIDGSADKESLTSFLNQLPLKSTTLNHVLLYCDESLPTTLSLKSFSQKDLETFMTQVKEILGTQKVEGWISVPVESLLHFKKVPFDLYVKIGSDSYVKRIPAHEEIDASTIEAFQKKEILDLHFEKVHNKDFSQMLINNMINRVDATYGTIDEALEVRTQVYTTVREIAMGLGLVPRVMEVCDSMIEEIGKEAVKEGSTFSRYLERLKTREDLTFQYRFIELSAFIGAQLLMAMDPLEWEQEVKRLVFAVFFCDISLKDPDLIHVLDQASYDKLSPTKQKQVLDHARQAAELVVKHQSAPLDIAIVIKQHHGSPDGVGFPAKKSPHLTKLTKCLIISQELAYGLLTNTHKPSVEVLRNLVKSSQASGLQDLVNAFERSLERSQISA